MRNRIAWFVAAALLAAGFGFYRYLMWGAATPNPHMRLGELQGLTPDQVTARFGPPHQDPRRLNPGKRKGGKRKGVGSL